MSLVVQYSCLATLYWFHSIKPPDSQYQLIQSQQALVDVLDQNIKESTGMREMKFLHKTSIMFLHKAL
jgi:hypothetical protein